MIKSNIKGVYFCENSRKWYAKTPHKKVLFRGDSMEDAEKARLKYDSERKRDKPKKSYKKKERFNMVGQPCWPASNV